MKTPLQAATSVVASCVAALLIAPATATAAPPTEAPEASRERRSWEETEDLRGFALMPRVGLGASGTSFATVILFGAGLHVFVGGGVAFGFEFDDTLMLVTERAERENPGLRASLPRHQFQLMPQVTWVMIPSGPLSPYVRAGLGTIMHDRSPIGSPAALGKWVVGLGATFKVDGFWIDLGIGLGGQFPDDRFEQVWRFGDVEPFCGIFGKPCSMRLEPRFGVGYAFGPKARER